MTQHIHFSLLALFMTFTLVPDARAQVEKDRDWTPHFQVACKADLFTPTGEEKKLLGVSKLFLPQDEMGSNTAAKIQMGPFTLVGMIEMKGKSESKMSPSFIMNIFNNNPVTTSIFNMGINGIYFRGIEREALEVEGMQFREITHEGQLYTRIDYACKIRARLTRKQFLMREIARKRAYIRYLSWKRDQAELRKKMEGPKEQPVVAQKSVSPDTLATSGRLAGEVVTVQTTQSSAEPSDSQPTAESLTSPKSASEAMKQAVKKEKSVDDEPKVRTHLKSESSNSGDVLRATSRRFSLMPGNN